MAELGLEDCPVICLPHAEGTRDSHRENPFHLGLLDHVPVPSRNMMNGRGLDVGAGALADA